MKRITAAEINRTRAYHLTALRELDRLLGRRRISAEVTEYLTDTPWKSAEEIADALSVTLQASKEVVSRLKFRGVLIRDTAGRYALKGSDLLPGAKEERKPKGVFKAVRDLLAATPWLTAVQIAEALPHLPATSVAEAVRSRASQGHLIRFPPSTYPRYYALPGTPFPEHPRRTP